jgi:hypothetical protein
MKQSKTDEDIGPMLFVVTAIVFGLYLGILITTAIEIYQKLYPG